MVSLVNKLLELTREFIYVKPVEDFHGMIYSDLFCCGGGCF